MLRLISITILLCCCWASSAVAAIAPSDCAGCHEKGMSAERLGRYVHQPFMRGACGQCHVVGEKVQAPRKPSALREEKKQQEKITWFQTLSEQDTVHWVLVPGQKIKGLHARINDGQLRSPLRKISLPTSGALPAMEDDRRPPLLTDLEVRDVRRGIGVSVVVRWQTDEFTSSEVYYGQQGLNSVKYAPELSRRHTLTLDGLDADRTYQFQVLARDVFGNETRSETLTFSTHKSFMAPEARRDTNPSLGRQLKFNYQAYRIRDDYLLIVEADRPVTLSLGSENQDRDLNNAERKVATAESFSHPILKSAFETNVKVCKTCHLQLVDGYSHPINVKPKSGMTVPEEYRLLPDGRLSCMSCHDKHASNNPYRLLKASKEDLCRGCHSNY